MIARSKRRSPIVAAGFDLEASAGARGYQRGCAGKDRYTSETAAIAGIGLQLGHPALDVYQCGYCSGGWHLTERRPAGQRKAPPVHLLAFVCAGCGAHHPLVAASDSPWTAATRRAALLKVEPAVIRDGWSVGLGDQDHCARCATALGIGTLGAV